MEKANKCSKEECDNWAGDDGLCNACRRGPMTAEKREAEAEEAKQRDTRRKRQKAEAVPPCAKCGGRQMLTMCARSCDGNSYTLPNGEAEQGCYMPHFPGFTFADGMEVKVCVDCGTVVGFDSDSLKAAIAEAEINLREQRGEE
jgi:hypothetical protein